MRRWFYQFVAGVMMLTVGRAARANVVFFDNGADWVANVYDIEFFETNGSNVASADEVNGPLSTNFDLQTDTLTFRTSQTGLSQKFTLRSLNSDWMFADQTGVRPFPGPTLSPGRAGTAGLGNDDWQIDFRPELGVKAFAFTLGDNGINDGTENMVVFSGAEVASFTFDVPTDPAGEVFFGFTSERPITSIRFDEGDEPTDDDIYIRDFRFATAILHRPCNFDGDDDCDVDDLDALMSVGDLTAGVPVPIADAMFDLTGDGMVDTADLLRWLADASAFLGNESPFMLGDTDLDLDVDTVDLTTAIAGFTGAGGIGSAWSQGDLDGDGDTDTNDLTIVIANFTGALSAADLAMVETVVPEPGSIVMLGLVAFVLTRRRSTT